MDFLYENSKEDQQLPRDVAKIFTPPPPPPKDKLIRKLADESELSDVDILSEIKRPNLLQSPPGIKLVRLVVSFSAHQHTWKTWKACTRIQNLATPSCPFPNRRPRRARWCKD